MLILEINPFGILVGIYDIVMYNKKYKIYLVFVSFL